MVREGVELSSEKVGLVEKDTEVEVSETRFSSLGVPRSRLVEPFEGWVSTKTIKRCGDKPAPITFVPPPAPAPRRKRNKNGPAVKAGFLDPTGKWKKKEFYIDPSLRRDYDLLTKNFQKRMYKNSKEQDNEDRKAMGMDSLEDEDDEIVKRTKNRRRLADHAIMSYNRERNEYAADKRKESMEGMTPEERRERQAKLAKYAAKMKAKQEKSDKLRLQLEREEKMWAKEKVKEAKGMLGVRASVDVGPTKDAFDYEAAMDGVTLWFPLPAWVGPKDVDVRLDLKWFSVGLVGERPYYEADLWGPIKADESMWHIETDSGRRARRVGHRARRARRARRRGRATEHRTQARPLPLPGEGDARRDVDELLPAHLPHLPVALRPHAARRRPGHAAPAAVDRRGGGVPRQVPA